MTWPPRLRALSNIALRSGSLEFSCTAGTRAIGPSACAGTASAATSAATIATRTRCDSLVVLFIAFLPVRLWLSDRYHAAPELRVFAGIHFVVVREGKLAVGADAEGCDVRRDRLQAGSVAHELGLDVRNSQHARARVERERAGIDAAYVFVLDQGRLPSRLVDRIYGDVVLAPGKDVLAVNLDRVVGAIGEIEEPAVRMRVKRARRLARADVVRLRQRLFHEQRLRIERAVLQAVDIELIFPLARHVHERQAGMELEVPRPEAIAAVRGDRRAVGELAVLEREHL